MSESSSIARSVHDGTATSFPSFSRLPKELRIMIWTEALPGPRIVFLRYQRLFYPRCRRVWSNCETNAAGTKEFFGRDKYNNMTDFQDDRRRAVRQLPVTMYGFRPQAASIPLLYVCRESWTVASKTYTRAFGTAEAYPETWFDFNRDLLYLDFDYSLADLSLDVKKVESLAVCAEPVDFNNRHYRRRTDERFLSEILEYFGKVKTLTLVNSQHTALDRGELVPTDVTSIGRSFLYFRGLDVDYSRSFDKRVAARSLSSEEIEWDSHRSFPFKIEALEHHRTHSEHGLQRHFELPKIERTTITALETKVMYDALMVDYRRKKERYRTRIYLRCQGYEDLKLEAGEMMSMEEVMKEFLNTRNISTLSENATIMIGDKDIDRTLTVYDLDLMVGDKLDIDFR